MSVTKASMKAHEKYMKENYTRLAVSMPKEIAEQFKAVCQANGVSYNSIIRAAVEEYIHQETGKEF